MLEVVFKLKDSSNVVLKEGDKKMYLTSNYEPSDDIEIVTNVKLKPIPAEWDKIKLLSAIYDVCKLKKAILFLIKSFEENKYPKINDKKLKQILFLVNKIIKSNFKRKYLIELVKTIKKINKGIKNVALSKEN